MIMMSWLARQSENFQMKKIDIGKSRDQSLHSEKHHQEDKTGRLMQQQHISYMHHQCPTLKRISEQGLEMTK